MLASLLANPSKAPTTTVPATMDIKIIPDIPVLRVPSTTAQQQPQQQQPQNRPHMQQQMAQLNNNNNLNITNNNLNNNQKIAQGTMITGRSKQNRQSHSQQSQQSQPSPSDVYLNQSNSSTQSNDSKLHQNIMQPPSTRQHNVFQQVQDSGTFTTSSGGPATPSSSTSTQQPEDIELSEILNDVIDIVPESNFQERDLNNILGNIII